MSSLRTETVSFAVPATPSIFRTCTGLCPASQGIPVTTYTESWCRFSWLFPSCSDSCLCGEQVTMVSTRISACSCWLALSTPPVSLVKQWWQYPPYPWCGVAALTTWSNAWEHTVETLWHHAVLLALFQRERLVWVGTLWRRGLVSAHALALVGARHEALQQSLTLTVPGRPAA